MIRSRLSNCNIELLYEWVLYLSTFVLIFSCVLFENRYRQLIPYLNCLFVIVFIHLRRISYHLYLCLFVHVTKFLISMNSWRIYMINFILEH